MNAKVADGPRPGPAAPHTLRSRRRLGLLFCIPGAALLVVSAVLRVTQGTGSRAYLGLAVLGLLLGLLGVLFLRRFWSAPGQPPTTAATWGRRAASAFINLWVLGILMNLLGTLDVVVPAWLRNVVAAVWALALVATAGLALYDRSPDESSGRTSD